jgi:hypothetical protein
MDESETARRKLLDQAFALARSGEHVDHRTIVAELQRSADYTLARLHLEIPGVLKQLDLICQETRRKAPFRST